MFPTDYAFNLILSVFLIVGIYQFYFWCQRNVLVRPRGLKLAADEWIPYWPSWVWVYSCLYYPVLLYVNLMVDSPRQFVQLVISYVLLLSLQVMFFMVFPVETPEEWRMCNTRRNWSERFLSLVQSFDDRSNSFPSMHCSVAMLTALHLFPHMGAIAFAFPALIGLSCVFTKQHYVIDIPAGAGLGWIAYEMFNMLVQL